LPHEGEALIIAPWPEARSTDEKVEGEMDLIMEIVRSIRNARAEYDVPAGRRIEALIAADDSSELIDSQRDVMTTLARIGADSLTVVEALDETPAQSVALVIGGIQVFLPLAGLVDLEEERGRLNAELEETRREIARVEKLLGNQGFVGKAPAAVVQKERDKLAGYREQEDNLKDRLSDLGG
jgi:valyl-tRNA synthetase